MPERLTSSVPERQVRSVAEQWKDIPGYEGLYMASDRGRVWSYRKKIILPGYVLPIGYKVHTLSKDKKKSLHYVHRLVLVTFVGPPPIGMEGCHGNGNALDNRLKNLRWDTRSGNVRDMIKHGTHWASNQKKRRKK